MVALRTPSMVMVAFPEVVERAPMTLTWSVQAVTVTLAPAVEVSL